MFKIANEYANRVKELSSNDKIYRKTIEDILKSLNNGKNQVFNEMLKYSRSTAIADIIAAVFSSMLNNRFFVTNINVGALPTIIKDSKGGNTAFHNSRPITVSETLSTVLEIFVMIDINRNIKLTGLTVFSIFI
jgi:hypothetical protein